MEEASAESDVLQSGTCWTVGPFVGWPGDGKIYTYPSTNLKYISGFNLGLTSTSGTSSIFNRTISAHGGADPRTEPYGLRNASYYTALTVHTDTVVYG